MKYPKPGYANPLVTVFVFDIQKYIEVELSSGKSGNANETLVELVWDARHEVGDSVISEVAWVGNETLVLKEVNRNADNGSVVLFDLGGARDEDVAGVVVRKLGKDGEEGDLGWIDNVSDLFSLVANHSHVL